MKGKRDPRFQQVYSPPFIFVRKSFQDANNDSSPSLSSHPLLEERTFWSAIYDIPPLFSAHPLLFRRVMEVINDYQPPSLSAHPLLVERTFWGINYYQPQSFSAHPLLRRGLGRPPLLRTRAPFHPHFLSILPTP